MEIQNKPKPFVWYQSGAEHAVAHDLEVFGPDKGRVLHTPYWGENSPGPAGSVMLLQVGLLGLQIHDQVRSGRVAACLPRRLQWNPQARWRSPPPNGPFAHGPA